jgi:hypothetical protein
MPRITERQHTKTDKELKHPETRRAPKRPLKLHGKIPANP